MKVTKWSTFTGDFDHERTKARAEQRRTRFPRCRAGRVPFAGRARAESAAWRGAAQEPALGIDRYRQVCARSQAPESLIPEQDAAAEMPQAQAATPTSEADAPHLPGKLIDHVIRRPRLGGQRRRARNRNPGGPGDVRQAPDRGPCGRGGAGDGGRRARRRAGDRASYACCRRRGGERRQSARSNARWRGSKPTFWR